MNFEALTYEASAAVAPAAGAEFYISTAPLAAVEDSVAAVCSGKIFLRSKGCSKILQRINTSRSEPALASTRSTTQQS